jgi:methylmalonyl-CoA/ethylmalonyl-CoA epimerase
MQIDGLDHVGVGVRERLAAERFFGETLDLERDSNGFFVVGRSAFELVDVSADRVAKEGISHLALEVSDLESAVREAADSGLRGEAGADCQLAEGYRLAWLNREATLGVRICLVERSTSSERTAGGAGGLIERIDHVGVASVDNVRAYEVFARRLGLAVESSQTDTEVRVPVEFFVSDKYGVVFNTRPAEAVGGLRVAFFTVGDCELEVLQDFDPGTASERAMAEAGTKRDQSAISRFIQMRGVGAHHIALRVTDIDAMLRRLDSAGVELIDRHGRPGSRRAQIAFLHPKSTCGVLFHLVQRDT